MSVRKVIIASVFTSLLAATSAASGANAEQSTVVQQTTDAYKALAAGDTAKAIAGYSEAIESRELPTDVLANALLNRALAYQQSSQFQDAIDDYAAALRIDTLNAKLRATALYNRGLAYQKVNRPALAIEDFTSALFLDSEFSYCYYSRGIALRDSGQYLFALSDFEKARRYNHPQPYLVYYGEALVFDALKRPAEEQKSLLKALALKPDFAPARQQLSALGIAPPSETTEPADVDGLTTGSITAASASQIQVKEALPAAVKPPESLLPETPAVADVTQDTAPVSTKKYTDRVPQEEPAKVQLASTQASVSDNQQEKVVAIEVVPPALPSSNDEEAANTAPDTTSNETATIDAAGTATSALTGWSVQLSSAKGEKLAWGIWQKLKAKHNVLADQNPVVIKADLGKKGIFYRLRLAGYDDQNSAAAACSKLKSKGVSCFISKVNS